MASFFAEFDPNTPQTEAIEQIIADLTALEASAQAALTAAQTAQAAAEAAQAAAELAAAAIPDSATSTWKIPVRVATTGDIDLSAAPAQIDGVALSLGDRVLVQNQTNADENGVYDYPGVDSPMTRSFDFDADAEIRAGVVVYVSEGTSFARQVRTLTTTGTLIVGTTGLTFENVFVSQGLVALLPRPYDIVVFAEGSLIDGNELLYQSQLVRDLIIPANFTGSTASLGTGPTGGTVQISIQVDGVEIGTADFGDAQTAGVFSPATPDTDIVVSQGEVLTFVGPTAGLTAEDLSITLEAQIRE